MTENVLEFRIVKAYENFILDVEASFTSGITAIFGPSGSGKSTLLNCLAGLSKPDGGEISIHNHCLFDSNKRLNLPAEHRHLGYVFQQGYLFPHFNVRKNIQYGFNLTPTHRRKTDLEQLIEVLELESLLDRSTNTLSGGERQRVALARALATSPDLLLLDEPLGSLDMRLRGRILRYFMRLHDDLSIPMVYVSHSISEVLAIATDVLVLSSGKKLAFDHPRKVFFNPGMHSLVETESLENLVEVEVLEHEFNNGLTKTRMGSKNLWIPLSKGAPGDRLFVTIRAGDIMVMGDMPTRISDRNVLSARIVSMVPMEHVVVLEVDVGESLLVELRAEAVASLGLKNGEEIFVIIKDSTVVALD